jgi:hypothetical protein
MSGRKHTLVAAALRARAIRWAQGLDGNPNLLAERISVSDTADADRVDPPESAEAGFYVTASIWVSDADLDL